MARKRPDKPIKRQREARVTREERRRTAMAKADPTEQSYVGSVEIENVQTFATAEMMQSQLRLKSDDILVMASHMKASQFVTDDELEETYTEEDTGYLDEAGLPVQAYGKGNKSVRRVFKKLKQTCQACGYRRICSYAPVALHSQRTIQPRARHLHAKILRYGLKRFVKASDDWYITLLNLMTQSQHDGHLAGCLLAEAWRSYPDRMTELLIEVCARTGYAINNMIREHISQSRSSGNIAEIPEEVKLAHNFRSQLIRSACFLEDEHLFRGIYESMQLKADSTGRLHQHEVISALTLFVTDDISATEWVDEFTARAEEAFKATFAWKLFAEDVIAIFLPYRHGRRRSYIYMVRNEEGREFINSIEKQQVDELIENLFAVFDSDEKKTYRIFKEICRHINVRAGKYNARHLLNAFKELQREELCLLALYAPALARAIGHFLDEPEFDLLIKFLYQMRSDSPAAKKSKLECHEKVYQERESWEELRDIVGEDLIKELFRLLFRLNAVYKKCSYTTSTFIKLGEAAYLLTAMSGWNPKGLDIELQSRKPIAYIAYGLQPPGKHSAIRARKFGRVLDKLEGDPELHDALLEGARYMATIHNFDNFEDLYRAALDGEDLQNYQRSQELVDELVASAEDTYYSGIEDADYDEYDELELSEGENPIPPPPTPRQYTESTERKRRGSARSKKLLESSESGSAVVNRSESRRQKTRNVPNKKRRKPTQARKAASKPKTTAAKTTKRSKTERPTKRSVTSSKSRKPTTSSKPLKSTKKAPRRRPRRP